MTNVAIASVLDVVLRVYNALATLASDLFGYLTLTVSDLLLMTTLDIADPFWEAIYSIINLDQIYVLDFVIGAIGFFLGYTLLKWITDVVL